VAPGAQDPLPAAGPAPSSGRPGTSLEPAGSGLIRGGRGILRAGRQAGGSLLLRVLRGGDEVRVAGDEELEVAGDEVRAAGDEELGVAGDEVRGDRGQGAWGGRG